MINISSIELGVEVEAGSKRRELDCNQRSRQASG